MTGPDPQLTRAVHASFIGEADALKPGNVSRYADGHDMSYADFVRSADAATPPLCEPSAGVGRRILAAVKATRAAVGCNTNLGMLLLFAPLVRARQLGGRDEPLRAATRTVLAGLDTDDTRAVFEAIRLASPGGLGRAPDHDVHGPPEAGLQAVMAAARDRDMIALQYYSNFGEIFDIGLISIKNYKNRWKRLEWAIVGCYLTFMARFPDTHVVRKHGLKVAEATRKTGAELLQRLENNNPEDIKNVLLEYDRELKNANINPGTSADLSAASLLLYHLGA